ncbi:spermatogenesis-associated protein 32 [Talpa occidentalis]|uniref:spermatogenesis-associated protein 32 n=1 Tax=Talpa occidentalis TaxID=50954 RepID=UPI00188F5331|nr:spermatogenesis-associated protein 32 [Talpa occidentalis]XP_054545084.1 spermatogenesis-associated protein 32 [Talpa occidentalis]XP_054545085.1 spermatogenesis-associated protein 32 [Talpa occidentalis]
MFPCCGKKSVNVVETQCDLSQYLSQDEEEMELETELLALAHTSKSSLDLDSEPEMEMTPGPQPQPGLDTESLDTGSSVECCPAEPEPQVDRRESLHPSMEELGQQAFRPCSEKSNSTYLSATEVARMPANHHSIHVQTSKHLFWADKLIQASQESVERAISMHFDKKSLDKASRCSHRSWVPEDTVSSQKQLQAPSPQSVVPATKPREPRSRPLSPELSPAIGLTELVNLATSLAMASSNKKHLPNMELRMQDPSKKAKKPATEPTGDGAAQPAVDQMAEKLTQALLEKPLEDIMQQKAWKQENKNFLYPYFDFNKPGGMRTTFEGKVKLVQSPAMFPPPQETKPDSLPRTKKESPLLLKIHFKVSSPTTPQRND